MIKFVPVLKTLIKWYWLWDKLYFKTATAYFFLIKQGLTSESYIHRIKCVSVSSKWVPRTGVSQRQILQALFGPMELSFIKTKVSLICIDSNLASCGQIFEWNSSLFSFGTQNLQAVDFMWSKRGVWTLNLASCVFTSYSVCFPLTQGTATCKVYV